MEKGSVDLGPYRATRLWNDVIRTFRTGMPIKRHRRHMRNHDNCFTSTEAIDWLHDHLCSNPNFGPEVTRIQTTQLLQKFLKSRVFEDIRGSKYNKEFQDSGNLYRFTHNSPLKAMRSPLSSRTNDLYNGIIINRPFKIDIEQMEPVTCIPKEGLPECHLVARNLNADEIEDIWKGITLKRLQTVLNLPSLDQVLDPNSINPKNIIHNMTKVNRNGFVTVADKNDDVPHWVLQALKCLINWPDKKDGNLPNYPGFERDVFQVIKDYFQGLPEPLIPYDMHSLFSKVIMRAEELDFKYRSPISRSSQSSVQNQLLRSFDSVESLMMNLTAHTRARMSKEVQTSTPEVDVSLSKPNVVPPVPPKKTDSRLTRIPEGTCYETAFITAEPVTRIVQKKIVCNHNLNSQSHSTHYSDSGYKSESKDTLYPTQKYASTNNLIDSQSSEKQLRHSHNQFHSIWNLQSGREMNLRNHPAYKSLQHLSSKARKSTHIINLPVEAEENFQRNGALRRTACWDDICYKAKWAYVNPVYSGEEHVNDGQPGILTRHPSQSSTSSYHTAHTHQSDGGSRQSSYDSLLDNAEPVIPRQTCPMNFSSFPSAQKGNLQKHISLSSTNITNSTPISGDFDTLRRWDSSPSKVIAQDIKATLVKICMPGFVTESGRMCGQEALQICCLLLPPGSKRKLHLLLRLVNRISQNKDLILDNSISSRALLIQVFWRCIIQSKDTGNVDQLLALRLVSFMMDHYADIMKIHEDIKKQVEEKIVFLCRAQIKYCLDDSCTLTYCEQVSTNEYQRQKLSVSQQALFDLLKVIIQDQKMSQKEKKKKLKQFQKSYPEIYMCQFPTPESEAEVFPEKPKGRPLLSKPLNKLMGIRM